MKLTRKITVTRRAIQIVSFIILMYGAFIWPIHIETPLGKIPGGTPRTTQYQRDRILWVSGKESVIDFYVPFLSCRFTARGGFFKSCSVHFFSENFTWRTSLKLMMPHILILILLMVLAGRFWCGWMCPLGAIMDFMTWLRRLAGWPRRHLSPAWQRFLTNCGHVVLWVCIAVSILISFPFLGTGANDSLFLLYCQFCPARLIYPILGGVNPCWYDKTTTITWILSLCGWTTLTLFFLGFVLPRFWCRVCAIGILSGYFNRGSLLSLDKKARACTSCGTCARNCPVDIEAVYRDRRGNIVTDPRCQLCLQCLEDCPEEGCLELKFLGKRIISS